MYTLISIILYSSIISTPVSMTKNQYPPNSGLDHVIDTNIVNLVLHLLEGTNKFMRILVLL
jgi:hypothetical protein